MGQYDDYDNVEELNAFNTEEFMIPARDQNGHSVRLWFNVPTGYSKQIEILLSSKMFPYRTKADLLRHGFVRHISWLESQKGPFPSIIGSVDAMNAVLRDDQYHAEYKEVLEKLNKQVGFHVAEGDTEEARRLLLEFLRHIGAMPDGFWKTKYKNKVMHDHETLLKSLPKASLVNFTDEE